VSSAIASLARSTRNVYAPTSRLNRAKAEDIETETAKHIHELDVDQAEKQRLTVGLDAIMSRVAELKRTTISATDELRMLIGKSDSQNQSDVYMVAKTTVALGKLLEIQLLDQEGKIL
jgi:hypothetical protein